MALYAGHNIPDVYWICAGCFMTSCGWVDALIYTLTRRVLLKPELSTSNGTNNTGPMPATPRTPALGNSRHMYESPPTVGIGIDDKDLFPPNLVLDLPGREKMSPTGITNESASDELELKAFDEVANHARIARVRAPPQTRTGKRSPNQLTKRPPDNRNPFSLPRLHNQRGTAANNNNEDMPNGNTTNIATGGSPCLPPIAIDGGIIVTNDVHVEHNQRSDYRRSGGHDA